MEFDENMSKGIGNRIRKLRLSYGLNITKLSELLDISESYLGLIERGQRNLATPKLIKTSEIFHVTLDYLVFGRGEHPTNFNGDSFVDIERILNPNELNALADVAKKVSLYNYTDDELVLLSEAICYTMNLFNRIKRLSGTQNLNL